MFTTVPVGFVYFRDSPLPARALVSVSYTHLDVYKRQVLELADFPGLSDEVLLSVIYPYCRGSLAELVTKTLRRGGSIDSLHGEVLDSFIPRRQREHLKHNRFYRAQANGCLLYTSRCV